MFDRDKLGFWYWRLAGCGWLDVESGQIFFLFFVDQVFGPAQRGMVCASEISGVLTTAGRFLELSQLKRNVCERSDFDWTRCLLR